MTRTLHVADDVAELPRSSADWPITTGSAKSGRESLSVSCFFLVLCLPHEACGGLLDAQPNAPRLTLALLLFPHQLVFTSCALRLSSHHTHTQSIIRTSITMSAPMNNDVEMQYKPQEQMQAAPSDAQLEVSFSLPQPTAPPWRTVAT